MYTRKLIRSVLTEALQKSCQELEKMYENFHVSHEHIQSIVGKTESLIYKSHAETDKYYEQVAVLLILLLDEFISPLCLIFRLQMPKYDHIFFNSGGNSPYIVEIRNCTMTQSDEKLDFIKKLRFHASVVSSLLKHNCITNENFVIDIPRINYNLSPRFIEEIKDYQNVHIIHNRKLYYSKRQVDYDDEPRSYISDYIPNSLSIKRYTVTNGDDTSELKTSKIDEFLNSQIVGKRTNVESTDDDTESEGAPENVEELENLEKPLVNEKTGDECDDASQDIDVDVEKDNIDNDCVVSEDNTNDTCVADDNAENGNAIDDKTPSNKIANDNDEVNDDEVDAVAVNNDEVNGVAVNDTDDTEKKVDKDGSSTINE
jgi:hypothetical protein